LKLEEVFVSLRFLVLDVLGFVCKIISQQDRKGRKRRGKEEKTTDPKQDDKMEPS